VALLVVGWMLFSYLARRFVRPRWLCLGLVSVVGIVLLALTVLPYFRTVEVNESLDVAATAPQPVSPVVPPPAAPSPVAPPPAVPQEPVKLTTGQFVDLDATRGPARPRYSSCPTARTSSGSRTSTSPTGSGWSCTSCRARTRTVPLTG